MIVDTSTLVAMIRGEVEAQLYSEVIRGADIVRLSAANYVELSVVIDGLRDPIASGALDDVLAAFHIQMEPLTATQARIARTAYQHFGKRGWLEHISVRHPWRRRGLARAITAASLVKLRAAGLDEGMLGVDSENANGALSLYEGLGFTVHSRAAAYRRDLDR